MTISEMARESYDNSVVHGWHDEHRTFGDCIALCHSELSEALEDFRKGNGVAESWLNNAKPCGIPSELADVVIRIGDMCGMYGIDLEEAIRLKMNYNKIRTRRHGGKAL